MRNVPKVEERPNRPPHFTPFQTLYTAVIFYIYFLDSLAVRLKRQGWKQPLKNKKMGRGVWARRRTSRHGVSSTHPRSTISLFVLCKNTCDVFSETRQAILTSKKDRCTARLTRSFKIGRSMTIGGITDRTSIMPKRAQCFLHVKSSWSDVQNKANITCK